MVFERRSRIASVYPVILTPCMSGRPIEVGKNWLLAFFWSMLVLTLRESGSIENTMDYGLRIRIHCVLQVAVTASRRLAKHNGFWRGGQNSLCFQWIVNSPSSHIDLGLQANFLFLCAGFVECVERFA